MRLQTLLFIVFVVSEVTAHASDSLKVKRVKIYPLPAIGYSPETRWYAGAVTLFSFQSRHKDIPPGTVEFEFNYTQNKQFVYSENHELRLDKNKWLLRGENGYYRYPELFFPGDYSGSNKISFFYNADRLEIDNSFFYKPVKLPFTGLRLRYHDMQIKSSDSISIIPPGTNYTAFGVGPALLSDTRDLPMNASSGMYISASCLFFPDPVHSFVRWEADVRKYISFSNNSTLAIQVVLTGVHGKKVPFRLLALMGNEMIMRGYYQGRYRDSFLYANQAEYRLPLWRWFGMVAFAGSGIVMGDNNTSDFDKRISYGLGTRIRLDAKDKINLRFDYARGNDSDGFYISFGEAF